MLAMLQNREMRHDFIKGVVGVTSVTIGSVVSLQSVEVWLRIASLTVGLIVGILSALSILRKWNAKP